MAPRDLYNDAGRHAPTTTQPADVTVHQLSETVEGRTFQIEVSRVARDRWRAQIVRAPGIPTAMMPFYGPTPDAAAGRLTEWLTRAHRTADAANARPQN
jgi:hypothetical protein